MNKKTSDQIIRAAVVVVIAFIVISFFVYFIIQVNDANIASATCVTSGYADHIDIRSAGRFCYRINGTHGELIRPSELSK